MYAHSLQEDANGFPETGKALARRIAYCKAADAYLKCARDAPSQEDAQDAFRNAGGCFRKAAESLGVKAEEWGKAGDAYAAGKAFDSAVEMYRRGDLFDEAIRLIHRHKDRMDALLVESIIEVAKLHFFRKGEYKYVRRYSTGHRY